MKVRGKMKWWMETQRWKERKRGKKVGIHYHKGERNWKEGRKEGRGKIGKGTNRRKEEFT